MIEDLNKHNNEVSGLGIINYTRYENIFKVAKNDKYYFYNILKKIRIPENINKRYYIEITVNSIVPLTSLSYKYYKTQDLWWLICITNDIINPINNIEVGTKLKILNPNVVDRVIKEINSQINI